MDSTQNIISLCTGYGGLELGLHRISPNFRTVLYVEVEAFACTNLVAKIEEGKMDAAPVWTDIKTFDGKPFRGKVDGITGGYPCQGESVAGKRKGTKDPRWLWPYIARIIQAVRPVWCFFENVSGHLTLGFPEVYRSLRNLGYKVEAGLFTAAECGAPHRRERLFILAYSVNNTSRQNARGDAKADRLPSQCRATICRREFKRTSQQYRWPVYRGQEQYEWEEPRVVVNTRCKPERLQNKPEQSPNNITGPNNETRRQTQSRLGRAANGTSSRVDRLRLLGNRVVPQQAEKAFRELWRLI